MMQGYPGEKFTIDTLMEMKRRFDPPLEAELQAAVGQIDGFAPLLGKMVRFHLGWIETDGAPTALDVRHVIQGKRIRPYLTFLTAESLDLHPVHVAPIAAAIELLHNFTLVHDDIQDRSPNRRHRATVWRVWGDAQAINAGDALFATAQRSLLRMSTDVVAPIELLRVMDAFNAMTIDIVQGQTADLEFELRGAVSPDDYLDMIRGKTAAILRFSAWAGAIAAGAPDEVADQIGAMGEALGLGFQIRDDILGVWGESSVTGKDQADDIRRRKKSLPILLLLDQATPEETDRLVSIYGAESIDEHGVQEVRGMLDSHGIEAQANAMVTHYHRQAREALTGSGMASGSAGLQDLLHMLDARTS
jgi:geranylgeranyl diphosphate synthase type I